MGNIILVDDDQDDQMLFEDALNSTGHKFNLLKMTDGRKLIEHLEELKEDQYPFLIIMDEHMPNLSGSALVEALKKHSALHNIPVAVFTGSPSEGLTNDLYFLGANCVIKKPGNYASLVDVVQSLVTLFKH